MKIVFMGTPAFAVPALESLYKSRHEIVAVYTQPPRPAGRGQKDTPSPIHQFALEKKIPVYTPASLKSTETQALFLSHHADIAVVAAYGLLLPKAILDAYPLGCINVHPSLLPRWRGAAPIQRTIMAGDHKTAIVIMQMDEGLDTGDMLMVEPYDIPSGTTAGKLHDTLAVKSGPLLLRALQGLEEKNLMPTPQPAQCITYAQKISKEECHIDWQEPAEKLYYHILGLSPSPGAYFTYRGENIKIFDARFDNAAIDSKPGTVLADGISVACNPGTITPLILQRPGKTRVSAEEFTRGFNIPHGSILG